MSAEPKEATAVCVGTLESAAAVCVGTLESASPWAHTLGTSSDISPFGVIGMNVVIPGENLEGRKEKGGSKTDSRDNHLDGSCSEPYLEEMRPVWRRKWQPTPVFLPGESQGQRSLAGCRLWGRTESDTTKAT